MNKIEFAKVWAYLKAGLTASQLNNERQTMEVYFDMLQHIDFPTAALAAKMLLAQSETPFLPAVGKILSTCASIQNPQALTHNDAWGEASKAVREYGYYRKEQALAILSPTTKRVIENIGWETFCHTENQDVLRGQFRKAYEEIVEREKKDQVIPANIRQYIEGVTVKALPE